MNAEQRALMERALEMIEILRKDNEMWEQRCIEARRVARVLAKSLEHICHDHDLAMEVVGVMLKLGESAAAVLVDAQKTALAYPEQDSTKET